MKKIFTILLLSFSVVFSTGAQNYKNQWGVYGTGTGQFSTPKGIAIDGTGTIYVVDNGNDRVQKYSAAGAFIGEWQITSSMYPDVNGIAIDGSGNVYLADAFSNSVHKYSTSGTFISQIGAYGSGNGQFKKPSGLAVDGSGNLYVTDMDNFRIQKFNTTGGYITQWGSPAIFEVPSGLVVDPGTGDVYVVDLSLNNVQKFNSAGAIITQWGTGGATNGNFNGASGVTLDAVGNVYVTDKGNNRIQKFAPDGTYLNQWGAGGTGNGFFAYPHGIVFNAAGDIFITEENNNRVQVFCFPPPPPSTIMGVGAQCPNVNGQVYSISPVAGAMGYTWGVPTGWTIVSGQGTTSITVNTGVTGQNGNITVTANNACGPGMQTTLNAIVNPAPAIPNISDKTICAGDPAATFDAGTGYMTYLWSANGSGTAQVITGSVPGNYTCTVTNSYGCKAFATATLTVNPLPIPSIANKAICAGDPAATFDAGVYSAYSWSGNATGTTQVVSGSTAGNYTCMVIDMKGCKASATGVLTVNPLPVVNFVLPDANVCIDEVTMALSGGMPIGGMYSGTGVTGGNFDPAAAGVGSHSLTYSYTDGKGCKNSTMDLMQVNALPFVTFVLVDDQICSDESAMLISPGSPAGGAFSGSGVTGNTYDPSTTTVGVHNITYTFTDVNFCKNAVTDAMTVNAVPSLNIPDQTMCSGDPAVTFDAGPGFTTYLWSGNGSGTTQTISGSTAGLYTCQVLDAKGCKAMATAALTVNALPIPFLPDQTICAGDPAVTFDAGVFSAYLWSGNGTGTTQTTSGTTAGNYTVQVVDINGCTASATGVLTVNPLPVVNLTSFSSVCKNDALFALTGGSPAGGAYSGTGVVSANFDPKTAGIGTFNITYTYVDVNLCSSSKMAPITVTNHSDIHGYVTYGTDTVKSGWVILFADSSSKVMWDTIRSAPINPNDGSYTIDGVLPRKYILQAVPDPVDYPNLISTYHDGKFNWDSLSAFVAAPCMVTGKDIPTIELLSIPTGTAVISGYVYSDGSLKTNDPIPGLDIILDKIPPSQSVQKTTTDANGHYVFNNLPSGTYQVNIDVTGIGVDSLYSVTLGDNDSTQNNLDYCIDSTVYLCSSKTSVATVQKNTEIKIWPNPTQNQLMIQLPEGKERYSIDIFDLVGNAVFSKANVGNVKLTEVDLSGISEGIYIVKIASENTVTERKIIKQ